MFNSFKVSAGLVHITGKKAAENEHDTLNVLKMYSIIQQDLFRPIHNTTASALLTGRLVVGCNDPGTSGMHKCELTEFHNKTGFSKPLIVQEGTPNLNVTLRGNPKKFWGLFGQKAHKTHQVIPFHSKRGDLSLTLMVQGQTYNLNVTSSGYPTKL